MSLVPDYEDSENSSSDSESNSEKSVDRYALCVFIESVKT